MSEDIIGRVTETLQITYCFEYDDKCFENASKFLTWEQKEASFKTSSLSEFILNLVVPD